MTTRQVWYWCYHRARDQRRRFGRVHVSNLSGWATMDLLAARVCEVWGVVGRTPQHCACLGAEAAPATREA